MVVFQDFFRLFGGTDFFGGAHNHGKPMVNSPLIRPYFPGGGVA